MPGERRRLIDGRWLRPAAVAVAFAGIAAGAVSLFNGDEASTGARGTPLPSAAVSPLPPAKPTSSAAPTPHPVSLPALFDKRFDGRDLRLVRVLARNASYTRYFITYESGTLTISGVMNVPRGTGPFPVVILNHGYIDPDVYTNGRGLMREQDYLARRGYVVLHTDYRNHAQSDDDPNADLNLRLGYTEDVINAVRAVKSSSLRFLDRGRVGMLGRSMGGGVTLNAAVVSPGLVKAIVLFAPVSSNTVDNFNRWFRRGGERRALAERIEGLYGSPEENPVFWRNVSPRTFFERISVPLLVHHGTSDDSVPIRWTRATVSALTEQRKSVRYFVYEGEEHAFGPQWPVSMQRTVSFLDRYLKTG